MRDATAFVRTYLAPLQLPPGRETKIVEELAAQLEESFDALVAGGASDEDAWREIRAQLPDPKTMCDALLDAEAPVVRLAHPDRGPFPGETKRTVLSAVQSVLAVGLIRDLRASAKLLLKARGFTATTLLTLGICLGANIAIFTVVYGVVLRPLPVPESDRLVAFGDVYPTITPNDIISNTSPSYFERREALTALDDLAMFSSWFDTIVIDGVAQELRGMRTTPSLFRVLRVQPALGRAFTDAEGEIGHELKIILSHGLWQRLYGGDPNVLEKEIRLGWTGQRYTIVGVMPRGFSFFERGNDGHAPGAGDGVNFWIPLAETPALKADNARTRYGYYQIGRLRVGATIDQLRAQSDAWNQQMFERFPQFNFTGLQMYTSVLPLQEALTRGVRRILYLLWGGAAFVLLIGALNIANLSIARASTRARDLAMGLARGASRIRFMRELVLEGVLLAGAGGLAGIAIGAGLLQLLVSSIANLPNAVSVRLDLPVIAGVLGAALVVGVLIGLASSSILGRFDLNHVLTEGGRGGTGGRAVRLLRRTLIVAQVGASVVLLIGASLLLTTFRNLLAADAGFNPERVITATMFPAPSRYADQAAVATFFNRALESIRAIPGVRAAGITSNIALSGSNSPSTVSAADRPPKPGEPPLVPSVVVVSPGYFESMSTPLVRGRFFADSDRADTQPVAIVDERLAARLWPNENPLGKGVIRGAGTTYTVVGVVRDVRFEGLAAKTESIGTAYFTHTNAPPSGRLRWIAVKTTGDAGSLVAAVRSAVAAIDPDLPLSDIQMMSERTSRSLLSQRLAMSLASLFGVIALLLSAVGLYSVLAFAVARRTREIGIRMALGSSPRGIFRLVFNEGLLVVASGLVLGLSGAVALGRALEDQVYGVRPTDPMILGGVALAAGLIALLACLSPARRAMRVDPLAVLNDT
jgi:predicted permease